MLAFASYKLKHLVQDCVKLQNVVFETFSLYLFFSKYDCMSSRNLIITTYYLPNYEIIKQASFCRWRLLWATVLVVVIGDLTGKNHDYFNRFDQKLFENSVKIYSYFEINIMRRKHVFGAFNTFSSFSLSLH